MRAYLFLLLILPIIGCADSENKSTAKKEKKKKRKSNKEVTTPAYLMNYYSAANVPMTDFTYMPGKDTTLTYSSGTTLQISENSFLDENGNPISTPVEIKYREFHTTTDILVSGIPMTGPGGGIENTFMSAGMCEFRANSNGKPVQINPDQPIINEMSSKRAGTNYNLYTLNEKTGLWEENGKDETKNNLEEKTGLSEPKQQENGKDYFLVGEDTGPALKAYHNWIFQPVGNEKITQYFAKLADLKIVKKSANKYNLTLTQQNGTKNTILCHRVYSPGNGYNKAFQEYEEKINAALEKNAGEKLIERTFSMKNTGIYNCDAYVLQNKNFIEYRFNCKNAGAIENVQVLDKTLNSCFNFSNSNTVKLDKTHRNIIVIKSQGGKCAVIPNSEIIKWVPNTGNKCTAITFSIENYDQFKSELEKN